MICEVCKKERATQKHHKLKQAKYFRALYPEFIDDPRNIQNVCANCHVSHRNPKLIKWNELEFCAVMDIKPRSKLFG